jgi:hypothetical protein
MKSWKTTAAGIAAILGVIFPAIAAALDANPATDPNWAMVIPAVITAAGLLFARDANVSSEQQGLKAPAPTIETK